MISTQLRAIAHEAFKYFAKMHSVEILVETNGLGSSYGSKWFEQFILRDWKTLISRDKLNMVGLRLLFP